MVRIYIRRGWKDGRERGKSMEDYRLEKEHGKARREEEFKALKAGYLKQKMSQEQLRNLQLVINQAKEENRRERNKARQIKGAVGAAAAILAFVILPNTSPKVAYAMEQLPLVGELVKLVTFRSYEYEDEMHEAQVEVSKLVAEQISKDGRQQKNLNKSTAEINEEIDKLTAQLLEDFQIHVREELGYKELIINSEVIVSTPEYFTFKLSCYQSEASGYETNYYYTIDLSTGKRLKLGDLFVEGADYISEISSYIKEQMQRQMAENQGKIYWINSEFEDMDFQTITGDTTFYLNEKGNLVIVFQEGEVAPMYMGIVVFEIPAEVLEKIRK